MSRFCVSAGKYSCQYFKAVSIYVLVKDNLELEEHPIAMRARSKEKESENPNSLAGGNVVPFSLARLASCTQLKSCSLTSLMW